MPGTDRFRDDVWRRRPMLFRGLLSAAGRRRFSERNWPLWSETPIELGFFSPSRTGNTIRGRNMPDARTGLQLFRGAERAGRPASLLAYGVRDPALAQLQQSLGFNKEWRRGAAIASLATAGSRIGFHGGHEDVLLMQLDGEREWEVWSADRLTAAERQSLLLDWHTELVPRIRPPAAAPILRVRLRPGDALYIPGLFPHACITRTRTLSAILTWRGLSAAGLIASMPGGDAALPAMRRQADRFFTLLDDPPAGAKSPISAVTRQLRAAIARLPGEIGASLAENANEQHVRAALAASS